MREETCCHHYMSYSFRLVARDLLYTPSHRQDRSYHSLYTSHGAMAGTTNSSIGPPWGIDLTHHIMSRHCTTELHLAPAGIRTQYLLALNQLAQPLQLRDWSIDSTTELYLAPAGIRTQYLLAWNPLPQPLQMSVNTDVYLPLSACTHDLVAVISYTQTDGLFRGSVEMDTVCLLRHSCEPSPATDLALLRHPSSRHLIYWPGPPGPTMAKDARRVLAWI